jgi:hypothetical protein
MSRSRYYESMKELARKTRAQHGIVTPRVLRSHLRGIYRHHGVRFDLWPLPGTEKVKLRKLRGVFISDDAGASIMVARHIPSEQRVFTMAHELKHYLVDAEKGVLRCDSTNESAEIEIGAEVFAAEFVFPDADVLEWLGNLGVCQGKCKAEDIVHLKRQSQTTLSYAGLVKKIDWLNFAPKNSFDGIKWKKLEVSIFGEPFYKRFRR